MHCTLSSLDLVDILGVSSCTDVFPYIYIRNSNWHTCNLFQTTINTMQSYCVVAAGQRTDANVLANKKTTALSSMIQRRIFDLDFSNMRNISNISDMMT